MSRRAFGGLIPLLVLLASPGCERSGGNGTPPSTATAPPAAAPDATTTGPTVTATGVAFRDVPRPGRAGDFRDDPRIRLAKRMMAARRFDQAEMVMRTLAREDDRNARARFHLALALHKQKRYAQARPVYEWVLENPEPFPEIDHVFHFYGWCLLNLGELEAARAALDEHRRRVPEEPDTRFALGLIAMEEDRIEDAEAAFTSTIAMHEANGTGGADLAKAYARLGDVQLRVEDVESARQSYATAVELHPNHYEAWAKLARALARLDLLEESEEAMRQHEAAKVRVGRAAPIAPDPDEPAVGAETGDAEPDEDAAEGDR